MNIRLQKHVNVAAAMVALFGFVACDDGSSASYDAMSVADAAVEGDSALSPSDEADGDACYHLLNGPTQDVIAGTSQQDADGAALQPHTANAVALSAATDGWVMLASAQAGEVYVYLDQDPEAVAVTFSTNEGTLVPEQEIVGVSACPELARVRYTIDVGVGEVYLQLHSDADRTVKIVYVALDGEHHHDG